MSKASFIPDILAHALAAEAAWQAVDRRKHPRIAERLHREYRLARAKLAQDYSALDIWLFEWATVRLGERLKRRDELARLLKEAIEREQRS